MKSLRGSSTANNLLEAFKKKTYDHRMYSNYAAVATEQGYMKIANMFNSMAKNANEHARIMASFLTCSGFAANEICALKQMPVQVSDTLNNLRATAKNEAINTTSVYPEYSQMAYDEKYLEVAIILNLINNANKNNAKQSTKYADMLEDNTLFRKNEIKNWVCNRCGYTFVGYDAPLICPLCTKNQNYFEIQPLEL